MKGCSRVSQAGKQWSPISGRGESAGEGTAVQCGLVRSGKYKTFSRAGSCSARVALEDLDIFLDRDVSVKGFVCQAQSSW